MRPSRLEILLCAWAMLAVVAVGLLSGNALFGANRKKDPLGFWLTIAIQTFLGLSALVYGLVHSFS